MNTDKFGNHIHKRLRLTELFDISENILSKTDKGDFDLRNVRLTGVKLPLADNDAVNKQYVDQMKELYFSKEEIQVFLQSIKSQLQILHNKLETNFYSKTDIDIFLKQQTQ